MYEAGGGSSLWDASFEVDRELQEGVVPAAVSAAPADHEAGHGRAEPGRAYLAAANRIRKRPGSVRGGSSPRARALPLTAATAFVADRLD